LPQPRATTLGQQQHLTPPHGRARYRHVSRESDILLDITSESRPHGKVSDPCIYGSGLQVWSRTFTCANPTPGMGSGPPHMGSGPPTMGPQGSRTEHTRALIRTRTGVRCRHVSRPDLEGSGPYHIHSCSSPRRRPDAATWRTARGVGQRAEPGMNPLGYARLCIYYG
jgi:hypothetical protein